VPGRYIRHGYGFTSRGCPRRCWFCSVWKRDPVPRLLPIVDCWNILDDNLLACPRPHVEAVFAMLRRQKRPVEFTGGLEALSLQDYQVDLLASLNRGRICSSPMIHKTSSPHLNPQRGDSSKQASRESRTG